MKKDFLKKRIARYMKKKQLIKDIEYMKLEKPFITKARKNYTVSNILFNISEKDDLKKVLSISQDFNMYEWVIIVSYYSMYMSALAALARLGFKSKSHAATISVLKEHYVKKERLEAKHIESLSKAYMLSENLITKLVNTKSKRETAQYDATPAISRENAVTALADADEFVTKIEDILGKKEPVAQKEK